MKTRLVRLLPLLLLAPAIAWAGAWANLSRGFARPEVWVQFRGSSAPELRVEGHAFPTEHFDCSSTKPDCRASYRIDISPIAFPSPGPEVHSLTVNPSGAPGGEIELGTFDGSAPVIDHGQAQFPRYRLRLADGVQLRIKIRSGPPYPCVVLGLALCYIRRDELVFRAADGAEARLWKRDQHIL
ncbi:MAG: hypothetical protein IT285_08995 [Bdellovibrionales bacterium]|nr:hypothetical protein [Bdellovibrionales bacterium]